LTLYVFLKSYYRNLNIEEFRDLGYV